MGETIRFTLNGVPHTCSVEPYKSLLELLREEFCLTGTKYGCGSGDCGACTVLVDGRPICACLRLAVQVDGKAVLTIEGLEGRDGGLHPLQKAFIECGAFQCGFCTPGMIMAAKALLDVNLRPTEADIRAWLVGNICRCTGYRKIIEAVLLAAERMRA